MDREGRLRFLQIDSGTQAQLQELRPFLAENMTRLLDRFYGHALSFEGMRSIIGGEQNVARLKQMQSAHWMRLFEGTFDPQFFEEVTRIGHAHFRIGLEPRWYLGGYSLVISELMAIMNEAVAANRYTADKAFTLFPAAIKAIFLDMDLSISVYQEETVEEFKRTQLAKVVTQVIQNLGSIQQSVNGVDTSMETVVSNTRQMGDDVQAVDAAADTVYRNMETLAAASEEISAEVQTLASAMEEMSASLNEVSRNTVTAAQMTQNAEQSAEQTSTLMTELGQSAKQVDQVVSLIQGIASQTNLLALNATIEAASAGEAGRGFAVVATEVKALARQSADASKQIKTQIEEMQHRVQAALEAIQSITKAINEINGINSTVATTVEEQTATASTLSQGILSVSGATQEVSANVQKTAQLSQGVSQRTQQVNQALKVVAESVSGAKTEIVTISDNVRSATETTQALIKTDAVAGAGARPVGAR